MYLKALELKGFKSFPEKIRLEFNNGITAVVGPNGSGKSNISDAIRWVLGETSAKSLRGSKMEDVVFAGTESRKPLGFAEVSMIMDNSTGVLPVDFSEVTITRSVYRSGDSEYRINGSLVKLKDIHSLFMDTGIGKEGYSIIGQGKIDEILSERSEERRLFFEEAAGIVKYKSRRQEASAKLAKEEQNLLRVNDIIAELETQVGTLSVKSENAKAYLLFKERLKLIHINIFLLDVKKLDQDINSLAEAANALANDIEQQQKLVLQYKEQAENKKGEREQLENSLKEAVEALNALRIDIQRKESQIGLKNEQIEHVNKDIARLEAGNQKNTLRIASLSEEKESERKRLFDMEVLLAQRNSELLEKQKDFENASTQMQASEQAIENKNAQIIESLKAVSETKGELIRLQAQYEQLNSRKDNISDEISENEAKKKEALEKEKRLKSLLKDSDKRHRQTKETLEALKENKRSLENELAEKSKEHTEVSKKLQEASSRHKILSQLESGYEGYHKSVKAVLRQKQNDSRLKGIIGAVGSLVDVSKELEIAIEIALSGSVQSLVTESEEDAKKAIDYLKATGNGRATFLPLTSIKGSELGNVKERILKEQGVIGIAKELIHYDKRFEGIFTNLLGKVIIADNIDNAIAFLKKFSYSYKTVTLDGELLSPGGAITGGSRQANASGIVSRVHEINELKRVIEKYSVKSSEVAAQLDEIKSKLNTVASDINEAAALIQRTELEMSSYEQSLAQFEKEINGYEKTISELSGLDVSIFTQIVSLNEKIREMEAYVSEMNANIAEMQQSLDQSQSKLIAWREEKELRTKGIADLRVLVTELTGRIEAASDSVERIGNEIEFLLKEIASNDAEIESWRGEIITIRAEIENIKNDIAEKTDAEKNMQNDIAELEQKKVQAIAEHEKLEKAERETSELLSRIVNEHTKLTMKKEQAENDRYRLYDELWNEYELTHVGASSYQQLEMSVNQLKAEERKIKGEIAALGDVNVSAIEEYKAVKERYEFLSTQRNDILEAEEKLKGIINDLTELMLKQFSEQFKIISENFSKVFNEMFGGGRAELRLTDSDNILESGIEIIAQPPGKKLVNMMLLSGGERALTAIALLFSILRLKPSPFCVLDEVEAALDDINVNKFANYIKNFSDKTQFIVITHRQGTMEAADVLYGVTMQEKGVSKLVAIRLDDEAV